MNRGVGVERQLSFLEGIFELLEMAGERERDEMRVTNNNRYTFIKTKTLPRKRQ
jgi:hypothetical protein